METDGRIRSKNIGTGEVNSRTLDNIRSSNYDGSHTDPETEPGTAGWQILKNGIVVFNNAIIRGVLKAAEIVSGTLNIGTGGSITVGDPLDPLVTLDETGLQVGTDVVMDSTGLHVDGGLIQGVWFASAEDDANNVSLTTTQQEVCSLVIDPPAWVEQLTLFGIVRATLSNTSGGTVSFSTRITLDDGGSGEDVASGGISVANNETSIFTLPEELTVTLSPAGRTVTVTQDGWLSSGTNSANLFALKVLAFGVRSSFV